MKLREIDLLHEAVEKFIELENILTSIRQ